MEAELFKISLAFRGLSDEDREEELDNDDAGFTDNPDADDDDDGPGLDSAPDGDDDGLAMEE
jgi:hypothetical protein